MIQGRPEWFEVKKFGWGLNPVTWQGWLFTLYWATFISAPFIYFMVHQMYIVAGIWEFFGISFLLITVYRIMKEIKKQEANSSEPKEE